MQRDCICCHCGKHYKPNPRVKGQQFCSAPACQQKRKSLWQRRKMRTDADYKDSQADAQKRWRENHRDYWRNYRRTHPEYTLGNRKRQLIRNQNRNRVHFSDEPPPIAKMDALNAQLPVSSGTYELVPSRSDRIAKMDALIVQLSVLSSVTKSGIDCKDRTR